MDAGFLKRPACPSRTPDQAPALHMEKSVCTCSLGRRGRATSDCPTVWGSETGAETMSHNTDQELCPSARQLRIAGGQRTQASPHCGSWRKAQPPGETLGRCRLCGSRGRPKDGVGGLSLLRCSLLPEPKINQQRNGQANKPPSTASQH